MLLILHYGFFMSYVTGLGSFPKKLTSDEEQKYIEEFKNGSIEARNALIERNLRLVAHIVKKYSSCGKDTEDLISIGTIGLIKGIQTFNPAKGTRLATYSARCIENAMLLFVTHIICKLSGEFQSGENSKNDLHF